MKKIRIKTQFKDDFITRTAGEKLRLEILEAKANNETVELDFTGVIIASTSFFDESIAKLAESDWTDQILQKYVHIKRINPMDLKVLKQVCAYRGLSFGSSKKLSSN